MITGVNKMSKMTFMATGDSFITRRLPNPKNEAFHEISELIKTAEARFTNFEVTAHNFEGYPSAFSGGTWAIAQPEVLEDIAAYGFNLVNWANNHTMDYCHGGLEATERNLDKYGFVHGGAGKNLAAASDPKYLECASGRVAFIAVTSTFHESWIAGEQRPDVLGRPGINPLRYKTTHVVSKEKIDQLKAIAEITDINAWNNLNFKEGFEVKNQEGLFQFGNYLFKEGSPEGMITEPNGKDLDRVKRAIEEAKRQADYVIVSVHSHEMKGEDKSSPADFLVSFARSCIDFGATAVLGHGPHILRAFEVYKGCPIFYSLGNFIFQNDTVAKLPSDFFEKYSLGLNHNVADALDARSKNNTIGLGTNPLVWHSVMPYWEMEDGKLTKIVLYPIELGFGLSRYQRGWPRLSKNTEILEHLQQLSKPFGTIIDIEEGVGKLRI